MDWSGCPDVESVPGKMSGAWVVKGTRVQADAIVENAAYGYSAEEIASEIFLGVPVERIRGVLSFAEAHGFPSCLTKTCRTGCGISWRNTTSGRPIAWAGRLSATAT